MAYSWFFAPINSTYIGISSKIIIYFIETLIPRLIELFLVPFIYPEIFWIIAPLITAVILMSLYFGRYKNESIGWNDAFAGNIALLFVGLNLLQVLWNKEMLLSGKALFIYCILAYNISQLILNYFHKMPKKLSFFINSVLPINFINYFAIILIYSDIVLDFSTFIAGIFFFLIVYLISRILWRIAPMSRGSKIFLAMKEKKSLIEKKKADIQSDKSFKENPAKLGMIIYLILYFALIIIDRIYIDLSDYYLLIISAYLIIFSIYYIKGKKIDAKQFIKGKHPELIIGVFLGLLIFAYNLIVSGFFANALGAKEYNPIPLVFIISIAAISFFGEFFFRGAIYAWLKEKYSKHVSILIQAALFAILASDIYNIGLSTISFALASFLISFQVGILIGYARDEWGIASAISTSASAGILSIIMIIF